MDKINNWLWEDKQTTSSTNDDAVALSEQLNGEAFVISSIEQTSGRGRRGRRWESFDGNLFFSQGLVFPLRFFGQLVCLSALSLHQTVSALLPKPHLAQIKWPNDVLIDNAKISGTLLEKGAGEYIIIGIGVNIIKAPVGSQLLYPASSLRDKGINVDRLAFLRSYIDNFDNNYAQWQAKGFKDIRKQWLQSVKGLGEEITVHTYNGDECGYFQGLGNNGELLLKSGHETKSIYAGDIFYMKKEEQTNE